VQFEAKVISLRTRRYTEEEMNELYPDERNIGSRGFEEKPIGEDILAHITAENLEGLRVQVTEIAEKMDPNPIVVFTDAFPDSFLVGKQYHRSSPNPIFEQILFRLNPDHPAEIARREQEGLSDYQKEHKKQGARPGSEPASDSEPEEKARLEKQIEESHRMMAQSMGLSSYSDFIDLVKNSVQEHLSPSGNNLQEAIEKGQQKLMKQYYEHGGRGAYIGLENPKESLKNTTIQFRVISKREDMAFGNCCRYYAKIHGIELSCATAT
jgi:hypothetical protein